MRNPVSLYKTWLLTVFLTGWVLGSLPFYAAASDSLFTVKKDSLSFRKKKLSLKPTTDFDQRFSFIENDGVNIWGYRVGVVVNDKFKTGIGGYFLQQETAGIKVGTDGIPFNQLKKSLYFGTIYYEPFLFRRKRWEMSMVFELGYGRAVLDSTNKIRARFLTKTENQIFIPAGMGYSVNFIIPDMKGLHFLTYLGLNGMIGLRKAVFESDLKYNFDGWYWSIGTAIFIDKIFTDIKYGKGKKAN
ncbi:MAG: hypothetical protein V4450_04045 [Bacteroidota bacterium]